MKRLLILSGKGGTGKTTTAAAFIRFSDARAIADCDVDAPNLHLVTKFSTPPESSEFIGSKKAIIDADKCISCGKCKEHCRFDALSQKDNSYVVNEYLCEGCGVCTYVCPENAVSMTDDIAGEQILYKGSTTFSTAMLKMGRGNSGKLVANVKTALFKNAPDTDIAIIDGSPGIGCPVIASASGVDMILVVAEPSLSGINDLERLIKTAHTFQAKLAVCVNKWDSSPENTQKIIDFCKDNNIPFTGKIPYDNSANKAINSGLSIADIDCPAKEALFAVYKETITILKTLY